ncbi:YbaK/EbsC family protein [Peptostreptococcaceae bacterium AGR-M142]
MESLLRGGYVKFLDDGSLSYTYYMNLIKNKLKTKIEKYMFESFYIDIDNKDLIKEYTKDLSSYKALPLDLSYELKEDNERFNFKYGLLTPKKQKLYTFNKIGTKDDLKGNYLEYLSKLDELNKELNLNLDKLKIEDNNISFYHIDDEYNLSDILKANDFGGYKDEVKIKSEKNQKQEPKESEQIYTKDIKTIEELENYLNIDAKHFIKTMVIKVDGELIGVLLRGDRDLNTKLLADYLGVKESKIQMADEEDIKDSNLVFGFVGPIDFKNRLICDEELKDSCNMVCGANKLDYHIKNVNIDKDFKVKEFANLKMANEGDLSFDNQKYNLSKGEKLISIKLKKLDSMYLNASGKQDELYSLEIIFYIDKILASFIINNMIKDNIYLGELSYFDSAILISNIKDENLVNASIKLYESLKNKGINVFLDDRKERLGFKLKDFELMGIKKAYIVGKSLEEGLIELKDRTKEDNEFIKFEELI